MRSGGFSRLVIYLAAGLAVFLAACGGSSESSSTTTTPTTAAPATTAASVSSAECSQIDDPAAQDACKKCIEDKDAQACDTAFDACKDLRNPLSVCTEIEGQINSAPAAE